ncbi:MAG: DUF2569 family protein [Clostridia bacterium]|nr:DUF2569 family protein [Clostridia bacterium]
MSWKCEKCGKDIGDNEIKHEIEEKHLKIVVCEECENDSKLVEVFRDNEAEGIVVPSKGIYEKVGGWLLLFSISIAIVSPIITIFNMIKSWDTLLPYLSSYPNLKVSLITDSILSGLMIVLGVIAGTMLLVKNTKAVKAAKAFLWYYLWYGFISAFIVLVTLPEGSFNLGIILRPAFFFAIWYTYFKKSVRVYNTYQNE